MVSLLEELERRETVIRERLAELRLQVSELSEQLEAFEEMFSQVEVARMMVREVIDDAAADEPAPRGEAGPREAVPVSPMGVVTVPQWEPGIGVSVLPSGHPGRAAGRGPADAVEGGLEGDRVGRGGFEGGVRPGENEAAGATWLAHRGQPRPVRAARTHRGPCVVQSGAWRLRTLLPTFEGANQNARRKKSNGTVRHAIGC
ncbi:hypothetical protein AB0H17_23725 [Streptomyces olivoreticuli]